MILIEKSAPPSALVTYRATPDTSVEPPRPARYDGPGFEKVKPDVRTALVAEQRGVCCYCTQRIEATDDAMKIEHRVPQRGGFGDPSRDLDWTNLFGACCGAVPSRTGRGAMALHCDSAKGDRPLPIDPTESSHIDAIAYTSAGQITSTRREHQTALDEVLQLNVDALVDRRFDALTALQLELRRRFEDRAFPVATLEKLLVQIERPASGQLRPFCGYLAWWLRRAIRRNAAR